MWLGVVLGVVARVHIVYTCMLQHEFVYWCVCLWISVGAARSSVYVGEWVLYESVCLSVCLGTHAHATAATAGCYFHTPTLFNCNVFGG